MISNKEEKLWREYDEAEAHTSALEEAKEGECRAEQQKAQVC